MFKAGADLFLSLRCHELTGNGSQWLRVLSMASHKVCFSGASRPALQLNPSAFLFGFLLFLTLVLHTFQGASSALRVLKYVPMHASVRISSLGRNLALQLLATMRTACWAPLGPPPSLPWEYLGDVLFEQGPFP